MSSFWDFFWLLVWSFFFVAFLMALFQIIVDLFRDQELSGWFKALWLIFILFLPILGALVYLIARGNDMAKRQMRDATEAEEANRRLHPVRGHAVQPCRADRQGQGPARQRRHQPGRVRRPQGQGLA